MLEASLMQMEVGPLFGLFLQSFFIGITMRILSIVIFVIVYGRMIEIYCMVSLGKQRLSGIQHCPEAQLQSLSAGLPAGAGPDVLSAAGR